LFYFVLIYCEKIIADFYRRFCFLAFAVCSHMELEFGSKKLFIFVTTARTQTKKTWLHHWFWQALFRKHTGLL